MEVLSYVLVNIATICFSALSVFFLKYQSCYKKTVDKDTEDKTIDTVLEEKISIKDEEESEPEKETDIDSDTKETASTKETEEELKNNTDDKNIETVDAEKNNITFKKLLSDNYSFVVCMIMLNLALANALVAIYSNHVVIDIKSMLIVSALWPIALIDFREKKIPNAILKVLVYSRVVLLIPELILLDNQFQRMISYLVAALAIFIAAIAVGVIMKGSIGMGDVKLFIVLGLYLGLEGIWSAVFCSLIVSFFISVYLLCTKKVGRKDSIPFAPAIMLGTFLSVFLTGI